MKNKRFCSESGTSGGGIGSDSFSAKGYGESAPLAAGGRREFKGLPEDRRPRRDSAICRDITAVIYLRQSERYFYFTLGEIQLNPSVDIRIESVD